VSACAVAEAVASRYFGKGWAEEVSVRVRDWRAPPFDPGAETPAGSVIVVSESRREAKDPERFYEAARSELTTPRFSSLAVAYS
jgi:hypothetical protein